MEGEEAGRGRERTTLPDRLPFWSFPAGSPDHQTGLDGQFMGSRLNTNFALCGIIIANEKSERNLPYLVSYALLIMWLSIISFVYSSSVLFQEITM